MRRLVQQKDNICESQHRMTLQSWGAQGLMARPRGGSTYQAHNHKSIHDLRMVEEWCGLAEVVHRTYRCVQRHDVSRSTWFGLEKPPGQ